MDRIYAKSAVNGDRETLAQHTINDIKAGRRLIDNLSITENKQRLARDSEESLAYHDVGKSATGFQKSLGKGAKHWGRRHEIVSAAFAMAQGASVPVVLTTLTHHKTLPADLTTITGTLPYEQLPFPGHIEPIYEEMAKQWYDNIDLFRYEWQQICEFIQRPDLLSSNKPLSLAPLSEVIECWLDRDNQATEFPFEEREYVSQLRGLVMSADHLASAGTYTPPSIPQLNNYQVTRYQLYSFQERAAKATGNIILRAPTGSGKTEAALMWAQLNQQYNGRLFYALPTTASINAMYLRFGNIFPKSLVGLLHSRATSVLYHMFEGDNAIANQANARLLGSLVREMYYPIRVCTPHQILRYSLQGKGWEQMLSEFPHSVFIFDEIHAYNPKLTGLTMATVRYLVEHNARVMFLTATLPTFIRKLIEDELSSIADESPIQFIQPSYDNATDRKILEQKRHTVEPVDGNIIDYIPNIILDTHNAYSTLVVCNHVATSQQVYRALRDQIPDVKLLHSRFNRRDRNKIEGDLSQQLPKILVATQVVEVSLDLDFQQMFTEPAPIDALVQRMGRVNRRGRQTDPAKVYIFTQQLRNVDRPYTEDIRNDSLKVLTSLQMPLSEEALNAAADRVYGNGYTGKDLAFYNDGLNYKRLKDFRRYLTAGTNQDWIDEVMENDQEGSIDLLPEQLLGEYNILREQGKTIEANDLFVPVPNYRRKDLVRDGRLDDTQDLWVLKDCSYTMEIGLEID